MKNLKNIKSVSIIVASVVTVTVAGILIATVLKGDPVGDPNKDKTPNAVATPTPSPVLTATPDTEPTVEPTPVPSESTTPDGSEEPTPTQEVTASPEKTPTPTPTATPTQKPTNTPTKAPTSTPKPTQTPKPTDPPKGEEGYKESSRSSLIVKIQEIKNNLPRGYFDVNGYYDWIPIAEKMNAFCNSDAKGEHVPEFEGYEWREDVDESEYWKYKIFDFTKVKLSVPDSYTVDQIFQKIKSEYSTPLNNQRTEHGCVSIYCTGNGTLTVVVYFYNASPTHVTIRVV